MKCQQKKVLNQVDGPEVIMKHCAIIQVSFLGVIKLFSFTVDALVAALMIVTSLEILHNAAICLYVSERQSA